MAGKMTHLVHICGTSLAKAFFSELIFNFYLDRNFELEYVVQNNPVGPSWDLIRANLQSYMKKLRSYPRDLVVESGN